VAEHSPGAVVVADSAPTEWTVVTRDLFADFGEFNLTGLGFQVGEGGYALFDHVYLTRSAEEVAPPVP
jgi:hypothetical protein